MFRAIPYLLAVSVCMTLIKDGASGWFILLVLLLIHNVLKFIIMGPVSLVLLVWVWFAEQRSLSLRRTVLGEVG